MNTSQIKYALEQDPFTRKIFYGVFPSDKLPQTLEKYPCGFVANTDPSSKPGTHWVAFYFPLEGKGEFFDSYGRSPQYYKEFKKFSERHSWKYNERKLQSDWSDVCGQYCIFYLAHKARGYTMSKIVQLFSNNTMLNDAKVSHFVRTHFKTMFKQPFVGLIQCCKKLMIQ
jgi:hypothetical protein